MINQIKSEGFRFQKRKGNLLIALAFLSFGFLWAYEKWPVLDVNQILANVIGDTSFQLVISLCVAWFIGSELNERTMQNEIKLGYSRFSILLVRLIFASMLAIMIHISYILGAYIGAAVKYGIDLSKMEADNFLWLLVICIQIIALQSFTVFIVFLLKKALAAMVVATSFTVVGCNVIRNLTESPLFTYSCFSLAQDKETVTLFVSTLYAIIILVLVITATYLVFKKADMN